MSDNPIGLGTRNSTTRDPKDDYGISSIPSTSNISTIPEPAPVSRFIKPIKPVIDPFVPNESPKPEKDIIRPMTFIAKEKSIEEKIYIILYKLNESDDIDETISKIFEVCIGRTAAYMDIKTKLQSGLDIDIHRSYIMTETRQTETSTGDIKYYMIPYEECITVYSFCISVSDYYFGDDNFNIEDYAEGDVPEENRLSSAAHVMSAEQLEYRRMLEESIGRERFITGLREQFGPNNSNNI